MPEVPPFLWSDAGTFAAPKKYTVPGAGEVMPYTATATYVNASGQAILPALRIKSAEGALLSLTFPEGKTIANGSSSEVTFVPPFGSAGSGGTATATADYVSAPRSGYTQYDDVVNFSYPADYFAIGNAAMFADDGSGRPNILAAGLYEVTLAWQGSSNAIPAATQVELIAHYSNAGFPNTATNIDPGNTFFSPGTAQGGGINAWDIWQLAWLDIVTPPCAVWFTIQTTGLTHTAFGNASAAVRLVKLTESSNQGL